MATTLLKKSDLFKKIIPEEIKILSTLALEKTFPTGTIIFSQTDRAENVYLLENGRVALKTSLTTGLEITYEMIEKKGDPFGWSSLIEPFRHMTTAICLEPTEVLLFSRKDLFKLFPKNPHLGYVIMQNLCQLLASRLERTRRLLVGQI
ncbi:MAG: cyclic nucleotide-binding domain-containing protein [Thermodesulfobacteriota bacterium]